MSLLSPCLHDLRWCQDVKLPLTTPALPPTPCACWQVAPGTVFIVVQNEPKKSNSTNQKPSGTRTSLEPKSPRCRIEKFNLHTTPLPLPVVKEEVRGGGGANTEMIAVGVV